MLALLTCAASVVELTALRSGHSFAVTDGDDGHSSVVELTPSLPHVLVVSVGDGGVSSVVEVTPSLTCTTACVVRDDICKKTR